MYKKKGEINVKRRALSLVLALVMAVGMLLTCAHAEDSAVDASRFIDVKMDVNEDFLIVAGKPHIGGVSLSCTNYTYNGSARKPTVTVFKGACNPTLLWETLIEGEDYTVSYSNHINAGTATVTITGIGKYSDDKVNETFTIAKAKNAISAASRKTACSDKEQRFFLSAKAKGGAALSYRSNNKKIKVNDAGQVTISKGYVGSASIVISAKATTNYEAATKPIAITVNPKQVAWNGVTSPQKKYLKANWKKVAGCSGYQMQISLKSNFAGAKAKNISKAKTTYTVSGFPSKKTYYVRVRAYQKVGSKTYYGSWSKAKSVKVK